MLQREVKTSVRFRKDGRYEGRISCAGWNQGKTKYVYGASEEEVADKMSEIEESIQRGAQGLAISRMTLAEGFEDWLFVSRINDLKPSSLDRMEQTTKLVTKYMGKMKISDVSTRDLQRMINSLKADGYSYSTILKVKNCLNAFFKRSEVVRELGLNPVSDVIVPRKDSFGNEDDDNKIKFFNKEMATQLVETVTAKYGNGAPVFRLGQAIVVLLNTGLRVGEMIGLEWERDVDMEKRTITVNGNVVSVKDRSPNAEHNRKVIFQKTPKSKSGQRTICMNDACYEAMVELQKNHR